MVQVVLRYAAADRARALRIIDALKNAGLDVWHDGLVPPDILAEEHVRRAMAAAECVIILWSEATSQSSLVQQEVRLAIHAWSSGRLVLATLDDAVLPKGLSDIPSISIRADDERTLEELVERARRACRSMAAATPAIGIASRVGNYELKAVLADTVTNTIYDGWDSVVARRVVIKTMPLSTDDNDEAREALARFRRGAQAAGQLNHPNICAVYDYGETADFAYLVTEFIDGPTLETLFDQDQRFSLDEAAAIVGGILDALQYSHDRNVVHRNLKPESVILAQNGTVKITDLDITRLESDNITHGGMAPGTPAYLSPEQFLREKVDWRTDIYSTGVLLYNILTGQNPHEGTIATVMHKVLYGAPLLPSRLSTAVTPAVDKVVTRAMARKREDRFQSCTEFKAALLAALTATSRTETTVMASISPLDPAPKVQAFSAPPPPAVASGSRGVLFALLAGVVIAGGVGIGWFLQDRPAPAPVAPQLQASPAQPATTPYQPQPAAPAWPAPPNYARLPEPGAAPDLTEPGTTVPKRVPPPQAPAAVQWADEQAARARPDHFRDGVVLAIAVGVGLSTGPLLRWLTRFRKRPAARPPTVPVNSPTTAIQQPSKTQVFISYSRRDTPTVDNLVGEIEQLGYTVSIDRQLSGLQRYAGPIVGAIRTSSLVAVMGSRNAFESNHVTREIYVAGDFKKPFIVFLLDSADIPDEWLYFLSGFPRLPVSSADTPTLRAELSRLIAV